jgi:thiamine transport system ATP-binding protein
MIAAEAAEIRAGGFTLRADLAAPQGAVCALLGPSGAGKSTLLLALAGFLPLAAGRLAAAGRDLAGLAPAQRPLTLLFQDNNLFPDLTVAQNVGLGLRPDLRLSQDQRGQVANALAEVGLAGMEARKPEALSGGQRQRAALARALLRDRPVLLLDEPFAALGPAMRAEMLSLTLRIARRRGATVLMVSHDPADATRADLLAFCGADGASGRIDGARPSPQALSDPTPALAAYLGRQASDGN